MAAELPVCEIPHPRAETEAEQVAQTKDVIRRTAGIGIQLLQWQFAGACHPGLL